MGLRCLLGHEFSEPEIEREREETGEEAVTTVREVKTCARCGETRIVSENTEVTTIEQLADQATTAAASADPTPADPTPTDSTPTDSTPADPTPADPTPTDRPDSADAGASSTGSADRRSGYSADDRDADSGTARAFDDPDTDDAEILDETARSSVGVDAADAAPPTTDERRTDAPADGSRADDTGPVAADDDGAELIDDGPASARDESTDRADSSAGADADRRGFGGAADDVDAADDADNGVILDDADEAAPDANGERARGAWPAVDDSDPTESASAPTAWPEQRGADEGFSAETGDAADAEPEYIEASDRDVAGAAGGDAGSEIIDGENPDMETPSAGAATEYYCPECGMSAASEGNSMRAGDICPECKRGYVAERSR